MIVTKGQVDPVCGREGGPLGRSRAKWGRRFRVKRIFDISVSTASDTAYPLIGLQTLSTTTAFQDHVAGLKRHLCSASTMAPRRLFGTVRIPDIPRCLYRPRTSGKLEFARYDAPLVGRTEGLHCCRGPILQEVT